MKPDRSLIGQLQRNPGAAVFTFDYHDYHDYSARWIDDPHIGPALGDAIDCLYQAFDEKVIIVAHSMGGLAARYALSAKGKAGVDRAAEVSTVITFGTPNTGSLAVDHLVRQLHDVEVIHDQCGGRRHVGDGGFEHRAQVDRDHDARISRAEYVAAWEDYLVSDNPNSTGARGVRRPVTSAPRPRRLGRSRSRTTDLPARVDRVSLAPRPCRWRRPVGRC